jgi:hypothetical protein
MWSLRLHHLITNLPQGLFFEAAYLPTREKYQPEMRVLFRSFICTAPTCPLSLESFAGLQIRMTMPCDRKRFGGEGRVRGVLALGLGQKPPHPACRPASAMSVPTQSRQSPPISGETELRNFERLAQRERRESLNSTKNLCRIQISAVLHGVRSSHAVASIGESSGARVSFGPKPGHPLLRRPATRYDHQNQSCC